MPLRPKLRSPLFPAHPKAQASSMAMSILVREMGSWQTPGRAILSSRSRLQRGPDQTRRMVASWAGGPRTVSTLIGASHGGAVTPETISGASPHHGCCGLDALDVSKHSDCMVAPNQRSLTRLNSCWPIVSLKNEPPKTLVAAPRHEQDGTAVVSLSARGCRSHRRIRRREEKKPFYQHASHLASSDPFQLRRKYDDDDDDDDAAAAVSC